MTRGDTMTDSAQSLHLRHRAESALRERIKLSPEQFSAMSVEAAQHKLHDLQVHQIELEMQNEELRRIQAELDTSQARYFDFYDLAPVGYCTISAAGLVEQANLTAAALLGVTRADLQGQSLTCFILPDDQDAFYLFRQAAIGSHQPQTCELRLVNQLGEQIWALLQALSATDETGVKHLRIVLSNITERKATEAALEAARLKAEAASSAKSRFLASASHDLRQPAHALGMFVARLAQLPHDAHTSHLVDCIHESVRAMQDMLDGFFDLSQLDAKQTHITRVAFPISSVFDQLRHGLASAATDKGLRLRFRPSMAWVESDPGLLNRVLLNLVVNAVRYTQRGSVLVACRPTRDGTQLRLEVRDSGIGIAPHFHEDIFQEFFQIDNPERDPNKGLGVGLSIVARACRLLKHPIVVRSAPGYGTCFTVTVPLAPARPGGTYEDVNGLAPQTGFDGLRVLLVEDDAMGRAGVANLLTSWGCSVTTADGARAACDLYQQDQPPHIIISDYRLGGGINGIEAMAMLSALSGQRVAACLISGDTDANVRAQAQAAGLTLLHKPVRPAKLRSVIRHLIQPRPAP